MTSVKRASKVLREVSTCEVTMDKVREKSSRSRRQESYKTLLEFKGENLKDLDELKEMTAASSRGEVIRDALRWMFWCTKKVKAGGAILIEENGKYREVVFPLVTKSRQRAGSKHNLTR